MGPETFESSSPPDSLAPAPPPDDEQGAGIEQEPARESAETVRQLLDDWAESYKNAEGDAKQELAYKIMRMGQALTASGLRPEEVKIQEAENGVLAFYNPATGKTAITPEGLGLPPEHYEDTLVHEATHAGITTGKRVMDEGLTEIITRQRVSGAMGGVYESEQRQAQSSFSNLGINRVIDTYDFERPSELLELYWGTEWEDAWNHRWQNELAGVDLSTPAARHAELDGSMRQWREQLEKAVADAAPRLLERAEKEGWSIDAEHEKNFSRLAEERPESRKLAA